MSNRQYFFNYPVKNDSWANDNILKEHYKMIAIHWNKQQATDADSKAIQQIILMKIYIQMEIPRFSLLKQQRKLFWIFHKDK